MYTNVDKIASLIFSIRRKLEDSVYQQEKMPLSLVQLIALRNIESREGKSTMKDLSSFLGITPPSATSLANGLVRLKLVKRLANNKDRRVVCLQITKQGENVIERVFLKVLSQLKKHFEILTEDEQKKLIKILEKIKK